MEGKNWLLDRAIGWQWIENFPEIPCAILKKEDLDLQSGNNMELFQACPQNLTTPCSQDTFIVLAWAQVVAFLLMVRELLGNPECEKNVF